MTTSYPLTATSISGKFVQQLATALNLHANVTVLAPADRQAYPNEQPGPTVRLFRYAPFALQTLAHGSGGIPVALAKKPIRTGLVPFFLVSMLLACIINGRRHDVLCANWSISGVVTGLAGKFIRRPVITVLRGEDVNRAVHRGVHRLLLCVCLGFSEKIVAVSTAIADSIQSAFPQHAEKVQFIPNGVSDAFLNIPYTISNDKRHRLLFVGSLISRKSVGTLIEAMANLPDQFSLNIVGDGPESTHLKMKSDELGLARRIRFLGECSHAAMPGILADSDMVVLPSLGEGRANVILEAFAAAKPVVASDIDGNRELVGRDQRGMLFPPTDAVSLAACIVAMSDANRYHHMATAARNYIVEQGLTWEHCAQQYIDLIQEISSFR